MGALRCDAIRRPPRLLLPPLPTADEDRGELVPGELGERGDCGAHGDCGERGELLADGGFWIRCSDVLRTMAALRLGILGAVGDSGDAAPFFNWPRPSLMSKAAGTFAFFDCRSAAARISDGFERAVAVDVATARRPPPADGTGGMAAATGLGAFGARRVRVRS